MTRRVPTVTSSPPWGFRASLTRPHDGDSFFVLADTGFGGRYEAELRLDGVHAPEIHPMQPGGAQTLSFVNGWLSGVQSKEVGRRWPLWVEVVMQTGFEPNMDMTFTRYVATVWDIDQAHVFDNSSTSLNYLANAFLAGHPEWPPGD